MCVKKQNSSKFRHQSVTEQTCTFLVLQKCSESKSSWGTAFQQDELINTDPYTCKSKADECFYCKERLQGWLEQWGQHFSNSLLGTRRISLWFPSPSVSTVLAKREMNPFFRELRLIIATRNTTMLKASLSKWDLLTFTSKNSWFWGTALGCSLLPRGLLSLWIFKILQAIRASSAECTEELCSRIINWLKYHLGLEAQIRIRHVNLGLPCLPSW